MIIELFQLLDEITDNPDMEPEREQFRNMVHQFFGSWENYENWEYQSTLTHDDIAHHIAPCLSPYDKFDRMEVVETFRVNAGYDKTVDAIRNLATIACDLVVEVTAMENS